MFRWPLFFTIAVLYAIAFCSPLGASPSDYDFHEVAGTMGPQTMLDFNRIALMQLWSASGGRFPLFYVGLNGSFTDFLESGQVKKMNELRDQLLATDHWVACQIPAGAGSWEIENLYFVIGFSRSASGFLLIQGDPKSGWGQHYISNPADVAKIVKQFGLSK
jgi:hypothetical protein